MLRFRAYESVGYWLDELYALRISGAGSILEILRAIPETDDNPPLYYLLLAAWREVVGSSEVLTRGLTLFMSWLAVLILVLARKTLGAPVALSSGFFLAVLPGALFAVEARPYGLMILLSALLVVTWFNLLQPIKDLNWGRLFLWGILVALISLTHFYGALLALTLAAAATVLKLRAGNKFVAAQIVVTTGVAFVPFGAWIFLVRSTLFDRSGGTHWLQSPPRTMIPDFLGWVVGGTYLSAVLIGALIVGTLVLLARWSRLGDAKWSLLGLAISVLAVLAFAQIVSLWTPIWQDKYGIVLVPVIAVALATLIQLVTPPNMRWFAAVTFLEGVTFLLSALNSRPVIPNEPWREVAAEARQSEVSRALVASRLEQGLWSQVLELQHGSDDERPIEVQQFESDAESFAPTFLLFSPYSPTLSIDDVPAGLASCFELMQKERLEGPFGGIKC